MSSTINIAQVNILLDPTRSSYTNGMFIPVFQGALGEIAKLNLKGDTLRVLLLILANIDEKNNICLSLKDIAEDLKCSLSSVYRAIRELETMQIICHKGDRHGKRYELSSKLVNPRLAYRGNTRYLRKESLPLLLTPDGQKPLLDTFRFPELEL